MSEAKVFDRKPTVITLESGLITGVAVDSLTINPSAMVHTKELTLNP